MLADFSGFKLPLEGVNLPFELTDGEVGLLLLEVCRLQFQDGLLLLVENIVVGDAKLFLLVGEGGLGLSSLEGAHCVQLLLYLLVGPDDVLDRPQSLPVLFLIAALPQHPYLLPEGV